MNGNDKKSLTNGPVSPKITPDAFWNCVKRKAKQKGYGTLVVEFKVHDGEIRGAELGVVIGVGDRVKLTPY